MQRRVQFAIATLALVLFGAGCAKKKMSGRDARREQLRVNAEAKRQELQPAGGLYRGVLASDSRRQEVTLLLEVKDIPDAAEGGVDPVLVPILTGSMKLTFGAADGPEYFALAVTKADFDPKRQKVDIVVSNDQLKDVVLSLDRNEDELNGTWNAPAASVAGGVSLRRADPLNLSSDTVGISGVYSGIVVWEGKGVYQLGALTLTATQDKPDCFSVSGSLKLLSENGDTSETLVYTFDQSEFSPLTRQISLRGNKAPIYFIGGLDEGRLVGTWYSDLFGRGGEVDFSRGRPPPPPAGIARLVATGGTYYGTFKSKHPDVHLPSRAMLSLVPFQDNDRPGGIGISGNIRFYFGSYSSADYIELQFKSIEYNFYTRKLDAQTDGDLNLTVSAEVNQGTIAGSLLDDTYSVRFPKLMSWSFS